MCGPAKEAAMNGVGERSKVRAIRERGRRGTEVRSAKTKGAREDERLPSMNHDTEADLEAQKSVL